MHVTNVGSPCTMPPDAYWRRIYDEVGLVDTDLTVESFVDGRDLRAYFNSHAVAVRPSLALFRRRREHVERLAADADFLAGAGASPARRLFLFQAVFAALVAASVDRGRILVLPPTYCYPYNLHADVPPTRRAAALDDLVCCAWEGRRLAPEMVGDIEIREPLRAWLAARADLMASAV